MLVDFKELGESSKVWIYQTDRYISSTEEKKINDTFTEFCNQWEAHGTPLRTSFKIEHHYFIILGVDEEYSNVSGCSIDGSVRTLKTLQKELTSDFFDRNRLAFFINNEVKTYSLPEVKAFFKANEFDAKSLVFNNTITTKAELGKKWLVPAGESWLAKYIPNAAVAP
ncbi:MAG TPA: hypothetical protein VFE57_11730 [Cyclobacteriaceae bacterium]|nr:hypothetical protein [Cyclobacteriaceae bacterium]